MVIPLNIWCSLSLITWKEISPKNIIHIVMLKYLVFLKLVLVFAQHKLIFAIQPITQNDHVLTDRVFQAFTATDWFNCLQTCHDDPRCISYNYQRSAEANGLCELNDCGVEDFCDREGSIFYSPGFVFQQIRTSKVSAVLSKTRL